MRYRALDENGDYTFGQGASEFLVDVPAAPAQAVKTRLALAQGEWFLNKEEGTPYFPLILGMGTQNTYDQAIQQRILGTEGVQSLDEYASSLDRDTRALTVVCTITTIYGQVSVITPLGG